MTGLLLDGRTKPNIRDNELATPLQKAAHVGYFNVVSQSLAAGAEVDALDKHGKTALHSACDCAKCSLC